MQENVRAEVQRMLNKLSDGKIDLPVWNHAFEKLDYSEAGDCLDYWSSLQEILLGDKLSTKEKESVLELMKKYGYNVACAFSPEDFLNEDDLKGRKDKFWKLVSLALSYGYNLDVVGIDAKDGVLENFWIVLKYT